jgi:hypothetical protein
MVLSATTMMFYQAYHGHIYVKYIFRSRKGYGSPCSQMSQRLSLANITTLGVLEHTQSYIYKRVTHYFLVHNLP